MKIDTFVVPATTEVARGLDTEKIGGKSLRDIFLAAGAKIGDASCAACLGGPSDTFGRLNTPICCISTTNRNFPGRMGHKEAKVFLRQPADGGRQRPGRHHRGLPRPAGMME